MRYARLIAILFTGYTVSLSAQTPTTLVVRQPDCLRLVSITTASTSSAWFDNRQSGCTIWAYQYNTSNVSATTTTVQSASTDSLNTGPDIATIATFGGTTTSGSNPNTAVKQGSWGGVGYYPWMRVNVSVLTGGSGADALTGVLLGWRPDSQSPSAAGSGGLSPLQNPNLTRFQVNKETTLPGGGTEVITVQGTGTNTAAYFEAANVYCNAVFSVQWSQNGTAATTTTLTPVGVNGASVAGVPAAFSASNVGAGTSLMKYYAVADQTLLFDITAFKIPASSANTVNTSVTVAAAAGTLCRVQMQARQEFQ